MILLLVACKYEPTVADTDVAQLDTDRPGPVEDTDPPTNPIDTGELAAAGPS